LEEFGPEFAAYRKAVARWVPGATR
jgi:protein-S-isoprenylcysteine O-methyltransferase Ste14